MSTFMLVNGRVQRLVRCEAGAPPLRPSSPFGGQRANIWILQHESGIMRRKHSFVYGKWWRSLVNGIDKNNRTNYSKKGDLKNGIMTEWFASVWKFAPFWANSFSFNWKNSRWLIVRYLYIICIDYINRDWFEKRRFKKGSDCYHLNVYIWYSRNTLTVTTLIERWINSHYLNASWRSN